MSLVKSLSLETASVRGSICGMVACLSYYYMSVIRQKNKSNTDEEKDECLHAGMFTYCFTFVLSIATDLLK